MPETTWTPAVGERIYYAPGLYRADDPRIAASAARREAQAIATALPHLPAELLADLIRDRKEGQP